MTLPTIPQLARELDKLKEAVTAKSATQAKMTPIQIARGIAFIFATVAYGNGTGGNGKPLSPRYLSRAKAIHFALYGTPEIDLAKWGPPVHPKITTLDLGKPNALAPIR